MVPLLRPQRHCGGKWKGWVTECSSAAATFHSTISHAVAIVVHPSSSASTPGSLSLPPVAMSAPGRPLVMLALVCLCVQNRRPGAVDALHPQCAGGEVPVIISRSHDGSTQVHLLISHVHQRRMSPTPHPHTDRLAAAAQPHPNIASLIASSLPLRLPTPLQPSSPTSSVSLSLHQHPSPRGPLSSNASATSSHL